MQFIYLGEAKFYEDRMSEFLMVSKNLEIKDLSTGIEMNDQTSSNEESNEHDNNVTDENLDIDEDNTPPFYENGENVEPRAQTKPVIQNKSSNRRVRTGLVSEEGKLKCQDCEKIFNSEGALRYHTKSKHEGVKYACNQCDYTGAQKGNLTQHIESKHEGVKYTCNYCDHEANSKPALIYHAKSKHIN